MKSILLTGKNPSYNPYHPALILIKDIDEIDEKIINIITTLEISYDFNRSLYENLLQNKYIYEISLF